MDLNGQNIVCISFPDWNGKYMKSIVQVMLRLGKKNKVLFVNHEFSFRDVFLSLLGYIKAPVARILGFKQRVVTVADNRHGQVHLLNPPPVLPINWIKNKKVFNFFLSLNVKIVRHCINKQMKKLNMSKPIIINAFNPFYGLPFKDIWDEKLHLYYCFDENDDDWEKSHGDELENQYLPNIDAVIATSASLFNTKRNLNHNCFLIPKGVDYNFFSQGIPQKVYRPIIGYMGRVNDRINVNLMLTLINKFPHYDFWFVGPVESIRVHTLLHEYYNVKFLGARSVYELPDLAATFSVGLIPFVKSPSTTSVTSLKLNQYLSAGIPVVSTNFTNLESYDNVVRVCNTTEAFCKAISTSISKENNTTKDIQLRLSLAKQNSWDSRVEEMGSLIQDLIKQKDDQCTSSNVETN